jgi:hypothetical protein
MRVLIYKRTHVGDPDKSGSFGTYCCMGRVRDRDFDAVIGVGGISLQPVRAGIDRKITWIGIGPKRIGVASDGYPILAFEQFYLKNDKGPLLRDKAPKLADRMFGANGPRALMVDSNTEIAAILKLAMDALPSPALLGKTPKSQHCGKRKSRYGYKPSVKNSKIISVQPP